MLSIYNKQVRAFVPSKSLLFSGLFFILITSPIFSSPALAQLNNDALRRPIIIKPENANEIRFGLYMLGFNKNNEYFNKIADGYTLFGYHFIPRLTYNYGTMLRLEAGAFIWKDFGSSGYQTVQPTFAAKIQKNNWGLIFGTLEGNLNHGYIEPLYDLERVISNRLENGMQFLYDTERVHLDAWIDWKKMIYDLDPDQEVINGGISSSLDLFKREGKLGIGDTTIVRFPFQFTAQHKGGQIDTSDLPLVTVVNVAAGLEIERKLPYKILKRVYTKNYLLGFKDFSNVYRLPFKEGHGIYLNVGVDTKYQDVMLSYWQGNGFITELGGKLYQSASTRVGNSTDLQEKRRIFILRFMKDVHLVRYVNLSLRFEPVLDIDNPALEFSNSFYLSFNTDFFLAKPRR